MEKQDTAKNPALEIPTKKAPGSEELESQNKKNSQSSKEENAPIPELEAFKNQDDLNNQDEPVLGAEASDNSGTLKADILVVNYGEYGPDEETIYESELYSGNPEISMPNPENSQSNRPKSAPDTKNPDDLEEIEFERFLRIFKEKTKSAAKKTKIAAHNLHENSLIRFAKWVDPKIAPYRGKTLIKSTKKPKVKSEPKTEVQSETNIKPTTEAPSSTPSQVPDLESNDKKAPSKDLATPPEVEQINQKTNPKSPSRSDYELQESAPYVPKTTAEFLSLMRRTPETVLSARERHVIATIMNFKNVKVSEIMQPAEDITYVNYEEVLGPLTLDRLYRAGYDHFPVVDNRHKIIGLIHTTALNSLEIKETSKAGDLLDPKVYYVREDYTLNQALAAFLRTNCYFFLVIDRYEKIVGMLTYQMLVNYLLGETPEDDFYRDEDRLAVAKRKMA